MPTTRHAVIDIGTNSVKLLVADVGDGVIHPVWEDSHQTRLGAGSFTHNRLQPEAIAQTAQAAGAFAVKARELNSVSTRIIATSAARDCINPAELTAAVESAAGLPMEIISGDQEADWVFQGIKTDSRFAHAPLFLLDVGGGSTEFILGAGEHKQFQQSFRLGVVRLLDKLQHSDPPTAAQLVATREFIRNFLQTEVRPKLQDALASQAAVTSGQRPLLVGTGGSASILARMQARLENYDREQIEKTRISLEELRKLLERLWALTFAERKTIVGLPKSRADVILPGAAIYEGVMETFGFTELLISTRGLRFAAVMNTARTLAECHR